MYEREGQPSIDPCGTSGRLPGGGGRAGHTTLAAGFVGEHELADLLFRREVRRVGRGVVESQGKGYLLHEAVRVLGRRDGGSDPYGLTGTIEARDELVRAGASFVADTMLLGSARYRVERGVIAVARERLEYPEP
jgi:hypothetical protein